MTDVRQFGRYLWHVIWRMICPPSGRGVRRVIILVCLATGLGRLGIYGFLTQTRIPAQWYGSLLLILAGLLMWTTWQRRLAASGRIIAAITAGTFAWFGADVLPNVTSALLLFIMSWACIGEAASTHDN
jgi:hypothetical protein